MTFFGNKEGYRNPIGTGLAFEGLASTEFQTIAIQVDTNARDWGHYDGSTNIRLYTQMGYDSTGAAGLGLYAPFKNDAPYWHKDATMVVLAQELRDVDQAGSNGVAAAAFVRAIFKTGYLVQVNSAPDTTKVQRIVVRDNL